MNLNDTRNSGVRLTHVLVIEPDATLHADLELGLRWAGARTVTFARSGPEGLKLAASILPDLVLTEVMLPVLDGLAVATRLAMSPDTAKIPVIYATSSPAIAHSAVAAGAAAGVLAKPFALLSLRDQLQRILGRPDAVSISAK